MAVVVHLREGRTVGTDDYDRARPGTTASVRAPAGLTVDRALLVDLVAVLLTHERVTRALDVLILIRMVGQAMEYPSWLTTETTRVRRTLEAILTDAPPD